MEKHKTGVLFPFEFNIVEGGAQQSIIQILKYINKGLFDIYVLLPNENMSIINVSSYCSVLKKIEGIQVETRFGKHGLWEFKKIKPFITIMHGLQFMGFIHGYIKKHNIRIIHANMYGSLFWSCLYKIIFNQKIKIIHHYRGFGNAGEKIIRFFKKEIDTLICTSDINYKIWRSKGFPHRKLKLIYNTVDMTSTDPVPEKENLIINVARISRIKNQHLFLKIADYLIHKRNLQFRYKLIGDIGLFDDDQTYYQRLLDYIEEKNLTEYVEFCGHQSKTELMNYYKKSFICVGCCPVESFGRVFIESMALGIPVIAVNNGGISSIIEHYKTGLLYPVEDFKKAGDLIEGLINNKKSYDDICDNARRKVDTHFNSITKITDYETLYQDLTSPGIEV
jgi:glycosyltransferase involved in cell wall biosynthesis